jgi:zinc protease
MRGTASVRLLPTLGYFTTLFLAASACGADVAAAPEKVASVEGITEYRLVNGLRVLVVPDPSSSTVTVNLTVLVGSRHEGYGETGMAHLLEHMVFKGTPTHRDVPKALRDHGAQFNGSTSVDRTNYFETMPASDANLEFGIRLEADRLVNSYVKREDLTSEMTVVRNEFERGENSPGSVLSEKIDAAAFEWHNYGKSTIGNRSDIERVPIENLQAFYRKFYQPDNCVLVLAGQLDEPKALGYAQKYFGAIPRPARKLDDTYTEEPPQDGERTVILRRVGKVGIVGAAYHIPSASHPDYAALQVLSTILVSGGGFGGGGGRRGGGFGGGGTPSGRLYDALVATGKATNVSASARGSHDPGLMHVTAQTDPEKLDAARDAMLDTLEQLAVAKPVTPDEVERAKLGLKRRNDMLMTRSNFLATRLSEFIAEGDWRLMFVQRDQLEAVSADDVNRVAATYLRRSNRTVGLFIPSDTPQRAAIPTARPIMEVVKNVKSSQTVAQGEAFDPSPANVESRTQRLTLPSGVKAALLPKKTRAERVTVELALHFGNEQSLNGQTTAASFIGPLLRRGTRNHTSDQLRDELNRLNATISVASGTDSLTAIVSSSKQSLPAALKLLREVLREPAFPAKDFEEMKRSRREGVEAGRTEPTALAQQALQRTLNPYPKGNVRYVPTLDEQVAEINSVTLEQVKQLYAAQVGGENGEVAVVGEFDPAETVRLIGDVLKDWKAEVPYQRIARPAKTDLAGGKQEIVTPDKANALYLAALNLGLDDRDPDYPALVIGNFVFGGNTLSSRLGNRIRQKEGLSYGSTSQLTVSDLDKAGRFTMQAICNPVNIDKVDRAAAEELARFLNDGMTSDEVAEAKQAYLQARKVGRAGDQAIAGQLLDGLHTGRTMALYADLEKRIEELTAPDVTVAFRKHVDPSKLTVIRAGDFKR